MVPRPTRALAWLPVLLGPLTAMLASSAGCELVVDLDTMLVDGSPSDVNLPTTLDGYVCPLCTDISPDADLDGDLFFPEGGAKDAAEGGPARDGGAESSIEAGTHESGADAGQLEGGPG